MCPFEDNVKIIINSSLIIFLLGIFNSSIARELEFNHLPLNSELPSLHVNHIKELRQGFMLISTTSGARLFDGYTLREFKVKNQPEISPLNANIYTTFEDATGHIWFATSIGLYKFSPTTKLLKKFSPEPLKTNSLIDDNVRVITEDSQNNLWFGTPNGVSRFNPLKKQFTHFSKENLINEADTLIGLPRVIMQLNDEKIWFGTSKGLFQINLKTDEFTRVEGRAGHANITSVIITGNKTIWVGSFGNGIFKFDSTGTFESNLTQLNNPEFALRSDLVWRLFEDTDKKIWIGYWDDGLSVYDPKTGKIFDGVYRQGLKNSLPNKYIESISADSSGLVWIATTTGIATFDPINFKVQTVSHIPNDDTSLGNGMIFSIEESVNNFVWLGTENGLERWNSVNNEVKHYYHDQKDNTSIAVGPVWDIQMAGENHLLVATNSGIDLLNIESGKFKHFNELDEDRNKDNPGAYYSIVAKSATWFYVTGTDKSVILFNPFTGEKKLIFDAADHAITRGVEYFTSMVLSKSGLLWLGSTLGLYQYDMDTQLITAFSTHENINRLSDNFIYGLVETDDGVIWAATANGGINKISVNENGDSKVDYFTKAQGLPANRIHSLRADENNRIWFTTDKHFGAINAENNTIETFSQFNANERGYREGGLTIGANNNIYLGGSHLRSFQPEILTPSNYQPLVRVTGISHLHQPFQNFSPLKDDQVIEFNPIDTLVKFEFSSLDFARPEINQYRYQLVGNDKGWLYPGTENKAYYTHLAPGKYQFKVQGTNRDGLWSPDVATLNIIMHPSFYNSPWAYLFYLVSGTLILMIIVKLKNDKRKAELENIQILKQSEARLRDVLWGSGDVLWRWNIQLNKIYSTDNVNLESDNKEQVMDFDTLMTLVHPDDQERTKNSLDRHVNGEEKYYESQYRILNADSNQWTWVLSRGRIVELDEQGKPLVIAGTRKVIDDIKKTEKQLRYLADYDQLTRLPNRARFHQYLKHSTETAKRFDEKVALLYLDLDGFKLINDTLGHAVGDQLLQAVASRLTKLLRNIDRCARLGGDEFAIIIERVQHAEEVLPTLDRILKEISRPFNLNDQQVITSASVGIAIYPDNTELPSELLKHADFAMYEAKRNGKKDYQFYNAKMNALFMQRISIENELKTAIEQNQFETFYQARTSVFDDSVQGFEALIRWRHPSRGLVAPGEFIPIAEETGQILEIGEWILNDGCKQGASWYQQGWRGFISINIAALQFQQSDLVESVKNALEKSTLPPECLELEITEGTLIKDIDMTRNILLKLKKMGVKIALDDFGTGYSSLSYLQQLPIDTLKIDRSFINLIPHSSKSVRLCTAIVNMAHSLDFTVVAEGIEHESQLEFLRTINCEQYQGFLFAKPLPVSKITIDKAG